MFLFPSTFNEASSQQGLHCYTQQDHIYVGKKWQDIHTMFKIQKRFKLSLHSKTDNKWNWGVSVLRKME